MSGTNLARAGDYNQRVVLQAIRTSGETSRVALARMTGLTAPTIANITRRLVQAGLVAEIGRRQGARGQPAIMLTVNALGCVALGLNIDRDHLTLVVLDLAGQIRGRTTRDVAFAMPEAVLAFVAEETGPLLAQAGVSHDRVLGVGVALPSDLGLITLPGRPPGYARWGELSIVELLRPALPWPVLVDNDAAAAAMGEAHCGAGLSLPSFFYVLVSAGLGGGLIIDRHYHEGADRRSAEIGLLPDPTNPRPGATVQDTVSLSALFERLADAGHVDRRPAALQALTGRERAIVDRWADDATLALTAPLIGVNCLINPHAVLIGGRLPTWLTDTLIRKLSAALADASLPARAPIVRAALAEDAPAVGAATLPFLDALLPSDATLMQAGRAVA